MTHNESTPGQPVVALWSKFYQSQFANLLLKMKNTPDGGAGNLLDNSMVMLTSEMAEGHTHSYRQMPILFAGKAGGRLQYPDIHCAANAPTSALAPQVTLNIDYTDFGDMSFDINAGAQPDSAFANSSDVHMTVLKALGVPSPSYGSGPGMSTKGIDLFLT